MSVNKRQGASCHFLRSWLTPSSRSLSAPLLMALTCSSCSRSSPGDSSFAGWGDAVAEQSIVRWKGARVPFPIREERPTALSCLSSPSYPLNVHADAEHLELGAEALLGLELLHGFLVREGWPHPLVDGGLGGVGFDLYLVPDSMRTHAGLDGSKPWSFLDGASVFGVMSKHIDASAAASCAAYAYASALFLALDPAESTVWRHASAQQLLHLAELPTCHDELQHFLGEPWRNALEAGGRRALESIESALSLAELWQYGRQRTWEGLALRASPSLWEVLRETEKEGLAGAARSVALARLLLSEKSSESGLLFYEAQRAWEQLPLRLNPAAHALHPFGQAYVRVSQVSTKASEPLRVWFEGEFGARWALWIVRLDAHQNIIGVVEPTMQHGKEKLYTEVEPLDASDLLFIIANLGADGFHEAKEPFEEVVRNFSLTISR